ncbi:MAG: glycosyltransferase, partial [Dehalococcoidia bacterium]|nr:glycosyltransferase [Dehalococcoidia bacterium]
MKLMIIPQYDKPDKGDGGIRRVVEAQQKYLPDLGFDIVDRIVGADIVHTHAAELPEIPGEQPWIVSMHGLYWAEYEWPGWGPRVNAAVVAAMKRADHVTTPSEWVAYALKRGMLLRPTVLHHGIDPELWEPGTNKEYVLWNKARVDAISDPRPVNVLARMMPKIKFMSTFGQAASNVSLTGKKTFEEA